MDATTFLSRDKSTHQLFLYCIYLSNSELFASKVNIWVFLYPISHCGGDCGGVAGPDLLPILDKLQK